MLTLRKTVLALLFLLAFVGAATAKPRITVANDGFPTGQDTPEGAAVDLTRAFIRQDAAQFRQTCIRPYGAGSVRADYVEYLDGVAAHFRKDTRDQSSENPRRILRVFAARHLSADGPASYGYAIFNFQEVMFVDVEVALNNGKKLIRRTLVIEDQDKRWYAHPVPDVSPLLCYGLYQESPSTRRFADSDTWIR